MSKIGFNNSNNAFYNDLKTAVDKYFTDNKIKKTGDYRLYLKTFILIASAIACYVLLLNNSLNVGIALGLCMVLGFTLACIGFSVMHDANHGSYSTKPLINDALGLTLNTLGASSYFWKQKHNIIHHTYTNVDGIDDDIAKSPVIRQCETQQWVPAHKVQYLYLSFIYALSPIFWIFIMDFTKYFTKKIYRTDAWKMTPKNHVVFWVTKLLYAFFYIALPMYVWGFGGWVAAFLLMNATLGITLSFVFQLAHVVEITEFEHLPLDEKKNIESAWAEYQVRTTANFAMNNQMISWFVGGLNFQVEHHLFPKVSHVHYPAISKIVQEQCRLHGIRYNYYPTLAQALASHFRVMKALGKKPAEMQLSRAA